MRNKKDEIVEIKKPLLSLYSSFLEFVEDMRLHQQPLWEPYLPRSGEAPEDFIGRLTKREIEPEAGFVPETIYWAVCDGHVIGRISLRHRLEGNLHKIGGHIGYEVSPRWRKRGFATEMLHQVLQTEKAKEIGRLLLTCSPNNEASNKTILSNGGKFEKSVYVDFINENRNHYWIDLNSKKDPSVNFEVPNDDEVKLGISIRAAQANDAKELSKVAIQSKAYWPYEASFIEMCRSDLTISPEQAASGGVFVAESEDRIAGFYSFDASGNPPEMNNLFVLPEMIGKGIGFKLWNHAVELARSKGWAYFVMDADPYAAEKFYYKMGCYKIGDVESTVIKGRLIPQLRFDISTSGQRSRSVEIRIATEVDVPGIRKAIRSSIEGLASNDYSAEIIQSWGADTLKAHEKQKLAIREGKELTWVAVQTGKIVGFSAFSPQTQELRAVYIAADVARQGLGTKLLERVEKKAYELCLSSLKMHSSITAVPFYKSHGYSVLGEIKHTLSTGVQMTAIEMKKNLDLNLNSRGSFEN